MIIKKKTRKEKNSKRRKSGIANLVGVEDLTNEKVSQKPFNMHPDRMRNLSKFFQWHSRITCGRD